jgi:hypothetical protein
LELPVLLLLSDGIAYILASIFTSILMFVWLGVDNRSDAKLNMDHTYDPESIESPTSKKFLSLLQPCTKLDQLG